MTPAITVGANIYRLRKEARLTQSDLAAFLGVTKASVSKWETGQSYPDIELLPKIATYFDTSVDKLMGYEPQLSRAAIRRECARLREAFAHEPFDQAHAACQELVRTYYACYPLLVQIASLYLNHLNLAAGDARTKLAVEATDVCHRIRQHSKSSADIKMAEAVEAAIELEMGNPQAAIEALGGTADIDLGADILLANAYSALGQADDADKVLQGSLIQSLTLSLNRLAQMALLYATNPTKLEIAHERTCALIDAFDMEGLYANCAAMHLSFAMAYAMGENADRTLDCLEDYVRACGRLRFPLELHGDAFFDKAEAWLEDVSDMGTSAPRDEALIRRSMVESVTANPAFASLAEDPRFKRIGERLGEIARR